MPLASALAGGPTAFVRADVALDGEPIVGSFTVDGMTFAVVDGESVELVGVAPDRQQVTSSQEGDGSPVAPMLASGPDGTALAVPESVAFEGADYMVASIGAYAFYLSGVTSVSLPASVVSVDEGAFRSSDVASVEVDPANLSFASFDGILYDADLTRLLLIPGGRTGAARISSKAEEVDARAFSHCAGVTSISVDAGSDSYSSWDGLLYDADGTTLLRVPAGATDITMRDGCTAIAAGALEGCAQLTSITAPASVASISPDVFASVPTVSLPAIAALADDPGASTEATEEPSEQAGSAPASGSTTTQLTVLVALSSTADDLPEVDPSAITVSLPESASTAPWEAVGFVLAEVGPGASLQDGSSYRAFELSLSTNGGRMVSTQYPGQTLTSGQHYSAGDSIVFYSNGSINYDGISITYSNPGCTFNCYSLASSYAGSSTRWTSGARVMTTNSYVIWNVPITWNAGGGYWNGDPSDTANKSNTWTSNTAVKGYGGSAVPQRHGYRFIGWKSSKTGAVTAVGSNVPVLTATTYTAQWTSTYTIHFDGNVVDDDAHPATVPGDVAAIRDEEVELPAPTRFGYIFKGWATHPYGSTANGNQVFAPGDKVANLTDTPGDMVTLYALWALKYDADVPICAPADMTFALDATGTGEVRAVPAGYAGDFSPSDMEAMGTTHSAAIESRMAVPVEVESVSAEAAEGDGFAKVLSSTDGSAPEDQLSFTVASGDAKASVKAGQSQALSGLLVPEASDATPVAKLALDYGLSLADTAVVLANDEAAAVPVAKVSYTLDVIDGMASKWGFFMLDGGTPVTPTRIKAAADDIAANYAQVDGKPSSTSDYYPAFEDYLRDDVRGYVAWGDGVTYEVRIIGINHDDRSDGTGKAGLTFQFVDCLNSAMFMNYPTCGTLEHYAISDGELGYYLIDSSHNTNSGGWGKSLLRARMNPGVQTEGLAAGSAGFDDDSVWNQVPVQLDNIVATVDKRYCDGPSVASGSGARIRVSSDRLFLASLSELVASVSSWQGVDEGSIYQYWASKGVDANVPDDSLVKFQGGVEEGSARAAWTWWLRSCYPHYVTHFEAVTEVGLAFDGYVSSRLLGVVPCFAL